MTEAVTIAGAFELPPARYPDADANALFRMVFKGAMRDWPVRPEDIDGLMTSPSGGIAGFDTYIHDVWVSELGLRPRFLETVNLGGATFVAMVDRAAAAIRAGRASAVLCVSAGKFMKPREGGAELMAKVISEYNFEGVYGTFIPALYGLTTSQFMAERNITQEDLARVAVSARKWALLNPIAKMHKAGPLTIEDVLTSKPIASPFRYLDCSVPTDGGGAVLVCRADLGRKWARQPAYVLGYGECHLRGTMSDPGNLMETGATVSGPEAFRQAGLSPKDIKVAQLYDAFSSTPLILLENMGFCAPGESGAFVQAGNIDPGGSLPVNTYGGLMSFGHTGDSAGMSLLTAGAFQAMGIAGPNQVADASHVLIHSYGGMMYDHATLILGREA